MKKHLFIYRQAYLTASFLFLFLFSFSNVIVAQFCFVGDAGYLNLVGTGSGSKSSVGANFVQHMDYDLDVDFTFYAYNPDTIDSETIRFSIQAVETNTIHFEYDATDTTIVGGSTNTLHDISDFNFTYTGLPYVGYVDYSTCAHRIELLFYPLALFTPILVDSPEPLAIEYSYSVDETLRAQIALPQPWCYLDDPYYYDVPGEFIVPENDEPLALEMFTDNRFLDKPKLLATAVEGFSPETGKACADGSTETTIFKIPCGRTEHLGLRIKEDIDNAKPHIFGTIRPNPDACNSYFYEHPKRVLDGGGNPISSLYRTVTIQLFDIFTNEELLVIPVELHRAPVAFIHGLWADDLAFNDMKESLLESNQWTSSILYSHDYFISNSHSFESNRQTAYAAIRNTIGFANLDGFSTSRVNVVCHSMGGLLSRMFIQSDDYEDDFARFITINTPHSGTQIANFLLSQEWMYIPLANTHRPVVFGAIEDLQCNSYALWSFTGLYGLNGSQNLNKNVAPSHAIATTFSDVDIDNIWRDLFELIFSHYAGSNPLDFLADDIYSSHLHDLIVPLVSQYGGLTGTHRTLITDQWHGSLENSVVQSRVRDLLKADPDGNLFSKTGFSPTKMEYGFYNHTDLPSPGSVVITNPAPLSTFSPGELIELTTTGSDNVSVNWLSSSDPLSEIVLEEDQNAIFDFQIPNNVAGLIRLTVLGFSEDGYVDFDTLLINVQPNAQIDSIWSEPSAINTSIGSNESIQTYALYNDGIVRNITFLPSLSFDIENTGLAAKLEPGLIKAISTGTTVVNITYQNYSTSVPVIVQPGTIELLSFHLLQKQDVSCSSGNDGAATVGASGGISNYSYLWPNGNIGPTQLNLTPGNYIVTVTDFIGQVATVAVDIFEPNELSLSFEVNDETSPFANNGSVISSGSGGSENFTYLWTTGDTTAMILNLIPGEYCLTITDENACELSSCTTVEAFCSPINSDIDVNMVSCYDENDGTINIMSSSASPPVTYSWSNGNEGAQIDELSIGNYAVTITGADGCSTIESFDITQPSELIVLVENQIDIDCAGQNTGVASVIVTGGMFPYVYQWDDINQQMNNTGVDLYAGEYNILITDDLGCEESIFITIDEPDSLIITFENIVDDWNNTSQGAVSISIVGGVGNDYNIQWSYNGTLFSNEEDLSNLASGEYVVVVSDVAGCSIQDTIQIDNLTSTLKQDIGFNFKVFPNPIERNKAYFILLESTVASSVILSVLDVQGRRISTQKVNIGLEGSTFSLKSPSTSGIYWINIVDENGSVYTQKIIVH